MKVTNKMNGTSSARIAKAWGRIANALGEKGQGLVDELRGIFDEFETSEAEVSDEELTAKIEEIIKNYKEMPEEVANAIAKANAEIVALKNAINTTAKGGKLPNAVKNEICASIMGVRSKAEIKNAVEAVLVKNDITGLTFADVIDYAIVDNWGDEQGFYGKLHKTPVTKFFYSEADLTEAAILAKQWDKDSEAAKAIQTIEVEGKSIATKYIYKRQRIANEDLDEIQKSGNYAGFVEYITKELQRQWCNSVLKAMLVGDTTNAVGSRITTFETIGTKTQDDIFTTIVNPDQAGTVVFGDLWRMVQSIENPNGKDITLFVDPEVLAAASAFTYAGGGTTDYRGLDEMKAKLGVADIRPYKLHTYGDADLHAVALIADEYWVNEKNEIEVAYPNFEVNAQNWQFERNAGGAIHGIKSTAVLKEAQ